MNIRPRHGEAGAGSGGDEEDEGGRYRDCESPDQGLYNTQKMYTLVELLVLLQ